MKPEKKNPPDQPLTVRLAPELHEELRDRAHRERRKMVDIVREALEAHFKQHPECAAVG